MNKWGLHRPACTPGLDFLVANTGMSDRWICGTEGELSVVAAMRRVLEPACKESAPGRNLVLDVGSNSGMYGLMAIAAGCPTVFFDLQPACNKVVTAALLANGWTDRGLVVAGGLSETSGIVKASSAGTCDVESGRFPLNVQEAGTADQGDVSVPTEPLAIFIGHDTHILLMKVDTEGFEQRVLAGCLPFFERRLIKHAIVEVTPGHKAWETRGIDALDVAATFEHIVRAGYSFTLLGNVADVNEGRGTKMTDPTAVRDWMLARGVGQRDVLLSLV
jgi:FkbM family methyltransferase